MARTVADTTGRKSLRRVQSAVSRATALATPVDPTWPKEPPTYSTRPSGEGFMARTVPALYGPAPSVKDGAQGSRAPVAASNAAKLCRGTCPVPAAAPGGRTDWKEPAA